MLPPADSGWRRDEVGVNLTKGESGGRGKVCVNLMGEGKESGRRGKLCVNPMRGEEEV